jgi:hypothetical protein
VVDESDVAREARHTKRYGVNWGRPCKRSTSVLTRFSRLPEVRLDSTPASHSRCVIAGVKRRNLGRWCPRAHGPRNTWLSWFGGNGDVHVHMCMYTCVCACAHVYVHVHVHVYVCTDRPHHPPSAPKSMRRDLSNRMLTREMRIRKPRIHAL